MKKNLLNILFTNKRQKNAHFMDDAWKTWGIKKSNVETWLLFAPPYRNSWLRACISRAFFFQGNITRVLAFFNFIVLYVR